MPKTSTKIKSQIDVFKRTDIAIVAAVGLVMAASIFLSAMMINTAKFILGR